MDVIFKSQTGRDFVIEIDGQTYNGVIPYGMEGKEDEAILNFGHGKLEELRRAQVKQVSKSTYETDEVIIVDEENDQKGER